MTLTAICPRCARQTPGEARFCPACGLALAAATPADAAVERKVVTTLFADLVGFTALSERADPEDLDAGLRAYFELARASIERFGGGVEKFIGDAAVGLFGVPLTHEDDAERAVHAALAIVTRMGELPPIADSPLRVRVAVNTGPALVRLDLPPDSGEGVLAGDAVNTAARLLGAAPPMAVVVGETTRLLSARAIEYRELPPFEAKGKSRPVGVWLARRPIARRGVRERAPLLPIIGRGAQLGTMRGLLDEAIATRSLRFALVFGEAGIGKSRLVQEFFRHVDESRDLVCTWRQGHCPPYGEDLDLWALREIVMAHVGIERGDSRETIETKLRRAAGVDAHDPWLLEHLRPLAGLPATRTDRDENFAAWLKLIEGIANVRPTIVVIEDLHWASELTLAFLRHVVDVAPRVPLLMIGTDRSEPIEARLALCEHPDRVTRVGLAPLSREESRRLAVLSGAAGDTGAAEMVADRCGGNPLFAEELARHIRSAPAGVDDGSEGTPDSLLALLAARIDALPASHRALLSDAAVVGESFASDAVAALGGVDEAAVQTTLRHLEERALVRRRGEAALRGADEFDFRHVLLRDVAYRRMPRSSRSRKHAALARWLEKTGADDPRGATEVIAHHYTMAVRLAEECRDNGLTEELREPAVHALESAGRRALDVVAAERWFTRALDLAGDGPRRPYVLCDLARTLASLGRFREAATAFDEGVAGMLAQNDRVTAAEATSDRWYVHWLLGDDQDSGGPTADVPEDDEPTPELVNVITTCAEKAVYGGLSSLAIELATRACDMNRELGLPAAALAYDILGTGRCDLGDAQGLEDFARAVNIARERGEGHTECACGCNLGEALTVFRGPAAARRVHDGVLHLAAARHDELSVYFSRVALFTDRVLGGDWDTAVDEMDELDALLSEREDVWDLELSRATAGLLLAWRGAGESAEAKASWAERRSARTRNLKVRAHCLVSLAAVRRLNGRRAGALELLEACLGLSEAAHMVEYALWMPELIRAAFALGRPQAAERLVGRLPTSRPYDRGTSALLTGHRAEAAGDHRVAAGRFAEAEAVWARLGIPFERAQAALGQGRSLASLGEAGESGATLGRARDAFARLGARPALEETDALLASLR